MGKPFDVSKFRKSLNKSIDGLSGSMGFNDPVIWISTGNYCLNYLISRDFNKGVPLSKVSMFAGAPAAGKSLIVSGNLVKNAQDMGIFVVVIDTENALDEPWMQALGVDTSEEKMLKLNLAMVSDVAKVISDFIKNYRAMPVEDRMPVLIVIDSLGMLQTETAVAQVEGGDLKGDMGIKPKQLKAMIINQVNAISDLPIGICLTNHVYSSQDKYSDDIVSGGAGGIYAASIIVTMEPFKLKEDDSGNKVKEVNGIRSKCKVVKSRYNKPFESVEIYIPWSTGLDKYSGLFDLFEKNNVIVKDGNRYIYTDLAGNDSKFWRREYLENKDGILDKIMLEFNQKLLNISKTHKIDTNGDESDEGNA
jgi:recombination protein RecA